jgi:hypothetical protein
VDIEFDESVDPKLQQLVRGVLQRCSDEVMTASAGKDVAKIAAALERQLSRSGVSGFAAPQLHRWALKIHSGARLQFRVSHHADDPLPAVTHLRKRRRWVPARRNV